MKIFVALLASVVAAPLALAITAFLAGLAHPQPDFSDLPEEELGT